MSTQDPNLVVENDESIEKSGYNNESSIRSNSEAYNAGTRSTQQIHEEYNTGKNLAMCEKLIDEGRARDIEDEPKNPGEPVFIIGSGPSLDDSIELMKDWQGGIICSPSHARTFMYHGIEPTHIACLDPFESWEELEGVDWSKTRTKLVTHPGVWPDLFENWPNDILLYRQNLGRVDSFYATTQRNMYSKREGGRDKSVFNFMIRTEMTVFASSPPLQLFVANRLGYGMPFLAGCDWAFLNGKDRFTTYTVKNPERTVPLSNAPDVTLPIEWEKQEHPFAPPEKPTGEEDLIQTINGLFTTNVLLYYKKNMISAWRLYDKTIYTTDHGSVTEMPYISAEKVIRTQGRAAPERSAAWNHKTSERYLAKVGSWIVENETGGKNFIEAEDPEVQLHAYMTNMNRQYICEQCKSIGVAEDAGDHNGEACPVCTGGKLVQQHAIDIEKNMTRIHVLMAWAKKNGGAQAQTQFKPSTPAQVAPVAGGASNTPAARSQPAPQIQPPAKLSRGQRLVRRILGVK